MEFGYTITNEDGQCKLTLNVNSGTEQEIFNTIKELRKVFKEQWSDKDGGTNWKPEVEALINLSQKIGAVKLLKERTSLGLKEAKEACDYYQTFGIWNINLNGLIIG